MKMEIYIPTEPHECRCCFDRNAYCIANEKLGYYTYLCESCFDKLKKLEKPKKKIKKWQWLIFDKEDNSVYATNLRFACESEVQKYLEDEETDRVLYPIKESEIEIEVE